MSSRHSSSGGSPRGSHTPSSASYYSQQQAQQQQYLRPEDVYRMDRESSYFTSGAQSYSQSRQGSATSSPRYSDFPPPHQRLPSQAHSPSSYEQYAYQPGATDPFLSPSSRLSPPEETRGESRHSGSKSGSRRESPKDAASDRGPTSQSGSPKGKGKEREQDSHGTARRRSGGNDRRGPGGTDTNKKASGPANKLVSGVFIRY